MTTVVEKIYFTNKESHVSEATKRDAETKNAEKTGEKTGDELPPPNKAASKASLQKGKKGFKILLPIKQKIKAMKEWTHDRRTRMRVYNDDFTEDVPSLYITRIIMEDEIDLDTDEDRSHLRPDVKKITTFGGTPQRLQIVNDVIWDQFLPKARSPPRSMGSKRKVGP